MIDWISIYSCTASFIAQNEMRILYVYIRCSYAHFPRVTFRFLIKCILRNSLPKPVSTRRAQEIAAGYGMFLD